MSEPTRLSDLPNGTILRYDEAKSSHGVTLSIEQFVEWGVLVPVERCVHGRIDPHIVFHTDGIPWHGCPGGIGGDDE